jgi:hypothetical protein
VGNDIPATNFTGAIKLLREQTYRDVIDLSTTTYNTGDYLLIEVISGYIAPSNPNTNWELYLKCKPTFDCSWPDSVFDACSPIMTYNAALCRYEVTYTSNPWNWNSTTDIGKYLIFSYFYGGNGQTVTNPGFSSSLVKLYFNQGNNCAFNYGSINETCQNLLGTVDYSKTGAVFTLDFTNNTDYTNWKTAYNTMISFLSTYGSGYSANPADIEYYRFWRFDNRVAGVCGDTATRQLETAHYSAPVSFDDTNYIVTITTLNITNGLPDTCGNCTNLTWLANNNQTFNRANFGPVTSGVTTIVKVSSIYYTKAPQSQTTADFSAEARIYDAYYPNNLCGATPTGWCHNTTSLTNWWYEQIFFYNERVTITNIADPINNFKIQLKYDPATGCAYANSGLWTTVYEISNGIATTGCVGGSSTTTTTTSTTSTTTTTTTTTSNPQFTVYFGLVDNNCFGDIINVYSSDAAISLTAAGVGATIFKVSDGLPVLGYDYGHDTIGGEIFNMNTATGEKGLGTGNTC